MCQVSKSNVQLQHVEMSCVTPTYPLIYDAYAIVLKDALNFCNKNKSADVGLHISEKNCVNHVYN